MSIFIVFSVENFALVSNLPSECTIEGERAWAIFNAHAVWV